MNNFGSLRPQQTPLQAQQQAHDQQQANAPRLGNDGRRGADARPTEIERYWLQICVHNQWSNVAEFEKGLVALSRVAELVDLGGFQELRLVQAKQAPEGPPEYMVLASFSPGLPLYLDDSIKSLFALTHKGVQATQAAAATSPALTVQPTQKAATPSSFQTDNQGQTTPMALTPSAPAPFYDPNAREESSPQSQAGNMVANFSAPPADNTQDQAIIDALSRYENRDNSDELSLMVDEDRLMEFNTKEGRKAKRSSLAGLFFLFGLVLVVVVGLGAWIVMSGGRFPMTGGWITQIPYIGPKLSLIVDHSQPSKMADSINKMVGKNTVTPDKTQGSIKDSDPASMPASNLGNTNQNSVTALAPLQSEVISKDEIKSMQPSPELPVAKLPASHQNDANMGETSPQKITTLPAQPLASATPKEKIPVPLAPSPRESQPQLTDKKTTPPQDANQPPQDIVPKPFQKTTEKNISPSPNKPAKPNAAPKQAEEEVNSSDSVSSQLASLKPNPNSGVNFEQYRKLTLGFRWEDTQETMSPAIDNCRPADSQFTVCRLRSTPRFEQLAGVIAQFDKLDGNRLVAIQIYGKPVKGEQDAIDQFEKIVNDIKATIPSEQKGFDTRRGIKGAEFFSSLKEESNRASYFTYWPDNNGQFPVFVYAKLVALSNTEGYYHILVGKPKITMGSGVQ